MNFLSHYFLDRNQEESLFFVGISTPDLLVGYNRSLRLKQARLPLIMENDAPEGQQHFYNGVLRHFEVDRLFHSSEFFLQETRLISSLLRDAFGKKGIPRRFFVVHVLLELLLDRILIQQHDQLLTSFYRHYEEEFIPEAVAYTEWICQRSLPEYATFLHRFSERQFLYSYTDWEYLFGVIDRLLNKLGIGNHTFLADFRFREIVEAYEDGLKARAPEALSLFTRQLCQV